LGTEPFKDILFFPVGRQVDAVNGWLMLCSRRGPDSPTGFREWMILLSSLQEDNEITSKRKIMIVVLSMLLFFIQICDQSPHNTETPRQLSALPRIPPPLSKKKKKEKKEKKKER